MSVPSYELRNQSKRERKAARLNLGLSAAAGIGGGLALATGLPVVAAAAGLVGAVALGGVSLHKYGRSNELEAAANNEREKGWARRSSLQVNAGMVEGDRRMAASRINPSAFETPNAQDAQAPKPTKPAP